MSRRPTAADRASPATPPDDPLAALRERLVVQAATLDGMFAELAAQSVKHVEYQQTTQLYARLALRAQSNFRVSLDSLDRADRAARRARGAAA